MMAVQRRWNGIKIVKRSEDQGLLYYETRYIRILNQTFRNQILGTDLQCTHCGERMVESMVDRVCNQFKKVQIDAFEQCGVFSNSLMIKLSNNLIDIGKPGDQIEVVGFVVHENASVNYKKSNYKSTYMACILASSIQKIHQVNGVFDLMQKSDLFGFSNAQLPRYIKDLLESERSPYSTGQSIVDVFLGDWLPSNMFRKMKLSLLMR